MRTGENSLRMTGHTNFALFEWMASDQDCGAAHRVLLLDGRVSRGVLLSTEGRISMVSLKKDDSPLGHPFWDMLSDNSLGVYKE